MVDFGISWLYNTVQTIKMKPNTTEQKPQDNNEEALGSFLEKWHRLQEHTTFVFCDAKRRCIARLQKIGRYAQMARLPDAYLQHIAQMGKISDEGKTAKGPPSRCTSQMQVLRKYHAKSGANPEYAA